MKFFMSLKKTWCLTWSSKLLVVVISSWGSLQITADPTPEEFKQLVPHMLVEEEHKHVQGVLAPVRKALMDFWHYDELHPLTDARMQSEQDDNAARILANKLDEAGFFCHKARVENIVIEHRQQLPGRIIKLPGRLYNETATFMRVLNAQRINEWARKKHHPLSCVEKKIFNSGWGNEARRFSLGRVPDGGLFVVAEKVEMPQVMYALQPELLYVISCLVKEMNYADPSCGNLVVQEGPVPHIKLVDTECHAFPVRVAQRIAAYFLRGTFLWQDHRVVERALNLSEKDCKMVDLTFNKQHPWYRNPSSLLANELDEEELAAKCSDAGISIEDLAGETESCFAQMLDGHDIMPDLYEIRLRMLCKKAQLAINIISHPDWRMYVNDLMSYPVDASLCRINDEDVSTKKKIRKAREAHVQACIKKKYGKAEAVCAVS